MQEERRKAKQKQQNGGSKAENGDRNGTKASEESGDVAKQLPDWAHATGSLAMKNLKLERICDNPANISYSPATFSQKSQQELQYWLQALSSGESGLGQWKTMNFGKRRVCMFGEIAKDGYSVPASLPAPLSELAQELVAKSIFPPSTLPNHVLLNEYQPGQGIMPHTDGPMYEERTATAISIKTESFTHSHQPET